MHADHPQRFVARCLEAVWRLRRDYDDVPAFDGELLSVATEASGTVVAPRDQDRAANSSPSLRRWSLPMDVRGTESTNAISRGSLCRASRSRM